MTVIASMLSFFITSCLYLLLKTAAVTLFGKLLIILGRITAYQIFPHEFGEIFIKSCFSEKIGKNKVLGGGGSFDNFLSIVSLTSSFNTFNLGKKLNFKIMKSV